MGTLKELLDQLNENQEEQEKTASVEEDDKEAQDILNELNEEEKTEEDTIEQEKTAEKEGGKNMTLTDLYNELTGEPEVTEDIEKVAELEAEELEKVAQEQVTAGRFLAMGFMDELSKYAQNVVSESENKELPAQVETDHSPGPMHTAGESKKEYYTLVQKKVSDIIGKKAGDAATQYGQDSKVTPDAAGKGKKVGP